MMTSKRPSAARSSRFPVIRFICSGLQGGEACLAAPDDPTQPSPPEQLSSSRGAVRREGAIAGALTARALPENSDGRAAPTNRSGGRPSAPPCLSPLVAWFESLVHSLVHAYRSFLAARRGRYAVDANANLADRKSVRIRRTI